MSIQIFGLPVSRGVAIGRAVLVASSRVDVAHYFIQPEQVPNEIERLRKARDEVVDELQRLQKDMPKDAPHELDALLDVHLMLLQDEELTSGVVHWIKTRLYNAEWALTSQLEIIARQFDEMEDPYLRERKADMEQVAERVLHCLKGTGSLVTQARRPARPQQELQLGDTMDVPLVLVAHDLSPADMLQFKQSVFTGFVTDVGGKTAHTAIVARSIKDEGSNVTTSQPLWDVGADDTITGPTTTDCHGTSKCITLTVNTLPNWQRFRYKVYDTVIPLRNVLWNS